MESGCGDFESAADGEREAIVQAKSAEHEAGRDIYRCFAGVAGRDNIAVPAVKVGEVEFRLRPKFLDDFVL